MPPLVPPDLWLSILLTSLLLLGRLVGSPAGPVMSIGSLKRFIREEIEDPIVTCSVMIKNTEKIDYHVITVTHYISGGMVK